MKKLLLILIVTVLLTGSVVWANTLTFYDLYDYGWAEASVIRLAEKGIIKGVAPHRYAPGNYVSRAELCTLLHRVFKIGGDGLPSFPDVSADSYYYESSAALKALGILKPYEDGGFHPDDAVTREETMKLTGFLLERFGFMEIPDFSSLEGFYDSKLISPENKGYCALLVKNGFITGDGFGSLNPHGYLTRAETAVILDRIYKNLF